MKRALQMVCDHNAAVQSESPSGEPEGVSPRSTPVACTPVTDTPVADTPGSRAIRRLRIATCLLIAIGSPLSAFAQNDDDDDFLPGLHAKYTANGKSVERIDADVSFDWKSAAPDPRLPAGKFTVEWTGKLLIKKSGRYTFHAFVEGDCRLEIDGKEILKRQTKSPMWIRGKPTPLPSGERRLRLRFRSTNKSRKIHLFWSADQFTLEPIPANLLFRDKPFAELKRVETGRVLFDVHRCNRCHQRENDPPSPPGPDLTHVVTNLSAAELTAKIHDPRHNAPDAKMPTFGFTKDEAADVAAFLRSVSKSVKLNPLPKAQRRKPRKKSAHDIPKPPLSEQRAGEVLVRSVGCLACHSLGKFGNAGPYTGGDLTNAGKKRSAKWIDQWLQDPRKLNAEHRMPVFKLTTTERREIALFLSSKRSDESPNAKQSRGVPKQSRGVPTRSGLTQPGSIGRETINRGRKLVEQSRCAACHTIPGVKFTPSTLPDLSLRPNNPGSTCLRKQPDRKTNRPAFPHLQGTAIAAFLKSRVGKLAPLSQFETGRRILQQRNCTACHPRGLQRGIVETAGTMSKRDLELRGQSQGMIPPTLNAVGDKLLDTSLKTAIAGEQKSVRLPWLRVRMPRFAHTKNDSAALVSYLIAHDRIPGGFLDRAKPQVKMPSESQILVAGQTLLGIRGFSCIACHKVGEYEPRNVALGTRGSDLMQMAGRIRRPFFNRWTRSAIRIVPGMEMPSYHGKPVPGVLNDDVDLQLAVLWKALNDKRFKPPTNPSVVEQFLTVKPGAPARIIRDVFTVPKENGGGYVARSLAIGLSNGHNILFDLDTYSLRGWYFGDFARQRTQGKSWYWDMAGVPVMTGLTPGPDIILVKKDKKTGKETVYLPKRVNGSVGRFVGAARALGHVSFGVELTFEIDGTQLHLAAINNLFPMRRKDNEFGGIQRHLGLMPAPTVINGQKKWTGFPKDVMPFFGRPVPKSSIGNYSIRISKSLKPKVDWKRFPQIPNWEYHSTGRLGTEIEYIADLKRTNSKIKLSPAILKPLKAEPVLSVPGFTGTRLPVSRSIMPTAMTWDRAGQLAFTSLKGHVFIAKDRNGDGVEDALKTFEEGLAAPFGILVAGLPTSTPEKAISAFVIAHKPELLVLADSDKDLRSDVTQVLATGWGYNDNYHDWTCGIVRDKKGNLYVGLGSDYAQKNRPKEQSRWRGKVLRISPAGKITPVGHSFRYPTGLAMNHEGEIFVSDNQGVQNTFNEINHLQMGKHYGVPSRHEENRNAPVTPPAIQIPHPWTRSVNGIFFLPQNRRVNTGRAGGVSPLISPKNRNAGSTKKISGLTPTARRGYKAFAGHGIGCEYDNRFLIRFTLQKVDGVYQGACYAFSKANAGVGKTNFLGPLCGGVAPDGAIYIGSIYDSGWLGGRNTGDIVRLVPNGKLPNGIRELRVTKDGFEIDFIRPVNRQEATKPGRYTISGYTRVWKGSYATPDSGRHSLKVSKVVLSQDDKTVRLTVPNRRAGGYVYDVSVGKIGAKPQAVLWPATGYYTLHRIPQK